MGDLITKSIIALFMTGQLVAPAKEPPTTELKVESITTNSRIRVAIDQDIVETSTDFKISPPPAASRKAGTMYIYDFDTKALPVGSIISIYANSKIVGTVSYSNNLSLIPTL